MDVTQTISRMLIPGNKVEYSPIPDAELLLTSSQYIAKSIIIYIIQIMQVLYLQIMMLENKNGEMVMTD